MKNWKVTVLVIIALIWLVDAKPWRSSSQSSDPDIVSDAGAVSYSGNADASYDEERTETCPRCNGSGICRRCKGKGTYYNSITGETKECAVCKRNPGNCGTCDGYGALTASTYGEVMANESKIAANSRARNAADADMETEDTEVRYCKACMGSGVCKICGGDGTYRNSFDMSQVLICTACTHGSKEDVGKCQICGGDGILYN